MHEPEQLGGGEGWKQDERDGSEGTHMDLPTHRKGGGTGSAKAGQTSYQYYLATSNGKDLQELPVDLSTFLLKSKGPDLLA